MKEKGFRKSSFCGNDKCCVEVEQMTRNRIKLRDKRGKTVNYNLKEFKKFLQGVKNGDFDDMVE